jgi:hypothetical protein
MWCSMDLTASHKNSRGGRGSSFAVSGSQVLRRIRLPYKVGDAGVFLEPLSSTLSLSYMGCRHWLIARIPNSTTPFPDLTPGTVSIWQDGLQAGISMDGMMALASYSQLAHSQQAQ